MGAAPMVSLRGVSKSFGPVRAIREIDLDVAPGEVVCIIGPSGCGKSTLLRCINFLEEPDAGTVLIDGEPMGMRGEAGRRRRDTEANTNRIRARIGMVFQQFNVWPHLSAAGNLTKPLRVVLRLPPAEAERRAAAALARVGLSDKSGAYPHELSGGQQQRVAIARALVMEPKLLLFDEATSSLDPEIVAEVLAVMREIAAEGATMIVVTHELGFAAQVADRVLFMDGGRIVEQGPPQRVLHQPGSERLQRFLTQVLHHLPDGQTLAREATP